jgi:hypothetical protein
MDKNTSFRNRFSAPIVRPNLRRVALRGADLAVADQPPVQPPVQPPLPDQALPISLAAARTPPALREVSTAMQHASVLLGRQVL